MLAIVDDGEQRSPLRAEREVQRPRVLLALAGAQLSVI